MLQLLLPRSSPRWSLLFALVASLLGWAGSARAISGPEAVNRAEQWVFVGMPYCQCANHAYDSHGLCTRPDNADWDPYRSDCSGLVSWAWGLPPPGRVTWTFAPFNNDVSYEIDAGDLQPGDALNSNDHIMLFKAWVVFGSVATLIDEHNWGYPAREKDFDVSISGSTITRSDWPSNPFTAIRYSNIEMCQPHCEGSVMVGGDCGKGDCGAYGATCADDALGLRCVNVFCPPTGHAFACSDDTHTIECQDGAPIGSGDCSAYAAYCSTAGGVEAHCVSAFCVKDSSEVPTVHDVCLPNGQLGHCDAQGAPTGEDCPANAPCTDTASGAKCQQPSAGDPPKSPGSPGTGGTGGGAPGGGWLPGQAGKPASAKDDNAPMEGGCSLGSRAPSGSSLVFYLAVGLLALRRKRPVI